MDALFASLARDNAASDGTYTRDEEAADSLYRRLTRKQRQLIDDPARSKSARCPRRSGKSFAVTHYAFIVALRKPGARVALITLTLKSGKRNYWGLFRQLNDEFGLQCEFNETNMEIRFPNGSYLFLSGAETLNEIEKLRGDQYDLAIIDECKSFSDRIFQELLEDVLTPALLDREGTKVIIGTPGTVLAGEFYRATNHRATVKTDKGDRVVTWAYEERKSKGRKSYKWSFHSWTLEDNANWQPDDETDEIALAASAKFKTIWAGALQEKEDNNYSDTTPKWRREFLGEWVAGDSELVFSYSEHTDRPGHVTWVRDRKSKNTFGLPGDHDWRYVLGMDLGFQDDFAAVVLAYAETSLVAYAVWDYKSPHLVISDVVAAIRSIQRRVGEFDAIVADAAGLGLTIVETLNQDFGLPVDKADKHEKFDHIELLNSDFHDGKIKLDPESDLARELEVLQWDLSKGSKYELARLNKLRYALSCPDHLSDAFLYAWRYLYHHFSELRKPATKPNTPEADAEWNMSEKMRAFQAQQDGEADWLKQYVTQYERTHYGRDY
jgi:hypothetical protein